MPFHLPPLTRRGFVAGSLSAGAGLLLNRSLLAAETRSDPSRWVLMADIHVWEQREGVHRGAKPNANFAQAAREIAALHPRPAGVIVAGDCVFLDGHSADYAVLAELVQSIRAAGIPMHFALGNHDHRENFWATFPGTRPPRPLLPDKHVALIETRWANWFLLDSLNKTRSPSGLFGAAQLTWLSEALASRADKPALLVAHHDLNVANGLRDGAGFLKVAAAHKQVKAYFFGHTHEWSARANGICLVNLPATAWLFFPKQPRGWVDLTLSEHGATLVLNALDKKHSKHGQRVELKWRA